MVAILAVAVMAGLAPARAETHTATYLIPSPPGVLFTPPVCVPEAGIGGCAFPIGPAERPKRVSVEDSVSGTPVAFSVCQDVNGDTTCDLAAEPYARSCGEDLVLTSDFQPGVVVTVFVKLTEPVLCSNDNQAVTGTITLVTV